MNPKCLYIEDETTRVQYTLMVNDLVSECLPSIIELFKIFLKMFSIFIQEVVFILICPEPRDLLHIFSTLSDQ